MFLVDKSLLLTIAAIFAALGFGTLVRIVALRGAASGIVKARLDSLKTWWVLAVCLTVAVVAGQAGVVILLAAAAIFGLRELSALLREPQVDRSTMVVGCGVIAVYYLLILFHQAEPARQTFPVALLLLTGGWRALHGQTQAYLRTTAAVFWGVMLLVYGPSHAIFLFDLPGEMEPAAGPSGWFLFLVILTEVNDIMQAIVGRRFGRTKITPFVSPNKSLEGLLGGMASTVLLAMILAPGLTTLTQEGSGAGGMICAASAGLLISVSGFLGDINLSAVKRGAGVKDGSSLLPGQGGMIDRIDSLTFTAPAFYVFVSSIRPVTSG